MFRFRYFQNGRLLHDVTYRIGPGMTGDQANEAANLAFKSICSWWYPGHPGIVRVFITA